MRVTFLDVGQGDAVVIGFPDGKTLLIDAGPKTYSSDAGSRFIAPFLSYSGIRHINGIVLTHPHSDHLGGIPHLLRHFRVDQVMDAGSESGSSLTAEYLHCIDSLRIPRKVLRAGTVIDGFSDARLFVLHPTGQFLDRGSGGKANFNNQSVVIKLCYGKTSMLLPGDIEQDAEERLVRSYGSFLSADILKLGHHGGSTSSAPLFSSTVHPGEAVISVGANNKFGHPSPSVLHTFARANCLCARTDESGAIIFESDGTQWRRVDWR